MDYHAVHFLCTDSPPPRRFLFFPPFPSHRTDCADSPGPEKTEMYTADATTVRGGARSSPFLITLSNLPARGLGGVSLSPHFESVNDRRSLLIIIFSGGLPLDVTLFTLRGRMEERRTSRIEANRRGNELLLLERGQRAFCTQMSEIVVSAVWMLRKCFSDLSSSCRLWESVTVVVLISVLNSVRAR